MDGSKEKQNGNCANTVSGELISVVYNEDCLEGMKRFPDKHFDLAVVDPPYGINASKGTWGSSNKGKVTNYGKKDWDKQRPTDEYFVELRRVSKNQIIWGGNYFVLPASSCWLVWDKDNTGDFADCELAWTSFTTAVRKFTWRWNGMLQQNMKNKEKKNPPNSKACCFIRLDTSELRKARRLDFRYPFRQREQPYSCV